MPDPFPVLSEFAVTGGRSVEYVRLSDVTAAERNPKGHDLDAIKASIIAFGYTAPVVLDERTGCLVAGHGRIEALRDLVTDGVERPSGIGVDEDGAWTVPVVRGWASKDDAHAEALLVADNRLTEAGGWDNRLLAELLEEVADYSPDLLVTTGFSDHEFKALLDGFGDMPDLDDLANEVGEPTDEDALVRVAFKVPREIANLWKDALGATGAADDTAAAVGAVKAAHRALTESDAA